MYRRIFIPLININSNIYAFMSGILISLSTGIFVTLTFEPLDLLIQWHLFSAVILKTISGALCMMISAKISRYQSHNNKMNYDKAKSYNSLMDLTETEKKKWITYYIFLFLSFIFGNAMLALNWIIEYSVYNYC